MNHQIKHNFDVIIIGSGMAGLVCALELNSKLKVAVISKNTVTYGSSSYAQGGISAVLDDNDSLKLHIKDTLNTAKGLANKEAVELMVKESKAAIISLEQHGVVFNQSNGSHHLTQEGGHQVRRIAHIADKTGYIIQNTLFKSATRLDNIYFFEHYLALDLLVKNSQCYGVRVLQKQTGQVSQFLVRQTILATGGASRAYIYTSNPDTSTGDGMAMAYRAGCGLVNMEFNQFHPTCLYHEKAKSFLISESLRGEGAKLQLPNGDSFIQNYDTRDELAPRDIVAYAIDSEIKKLGINCVYLDISFKNKSWLKQRFPNIYQKCLSFGIDISKDRIPVIPAAHYTCGGIKTNLDGQTELDSLFAIGETAHTGVHGANRLASNSLLECVVFAKRCAKTINIRHQQPLYADFSHWDDSMTHLVKERVIVKHLWDEVRRVMWDFVGIVRNTERLLYAKKHLDMIKKEVEQYYQNYQISADLIELRNLTQIASIIVRSSLKRKESRGLYYNTDYPNLYKLAKNTIIQRKIKTTK